MNLISYILLILLTAALVFVYKKTNYHHLKKTAIFLFIVFLLTYMQNAPLIWDTNRLKNDAISTNSLLILIALLIYWFTITSILILLAKPFYKLSVLNHLIAYFVTPVAVLLFLFFHLYSKSLFNIKTIETFSRWNILLIGQTSLLFAQLISYWLKDRQLYLIAKKEIKNLLLVMAGMLIATAPVFMLYALVGAGFKTSGNDFNFGHRIFLYLCVILPLILYYLFHKKEYQIRHLALTFITYGAMVSYLIIYPFPVLAHPNNWPFHLCNTAMFILPLSITFKLKRIFYFTFFINIFGAFVAITAPNYGFTMMFEPRMISYWLNHALVFFLPFIIIELGIFNRPQKKQFFYSLSAFSVYFSLALLFNAWFSNYGHTDYFFLNSDFVVNKAGFSFYKLRLFKMSFQIGDLTFLFYPLYQSIFYFVYILLSLVAWFLYSNFYQVIDNYGLLNIKRRQLKEQQKLFIADLKNNKLLYQKGDTMIKIIDFGKRYGGSDRYAARHINLEIKAGEVFAFLGHNGAGKSTLIKSLVGIQPITEGKIIVNGYDIQHQSVIAKQFIGFVPDHYALYERLTGREYVNYIADIYNIKQQERNQRIKYYTELFQLTTAIDAPIKTYSHGMKQKVAIIAALIHEPKIWILDEPLTGLDPTSVFQVKQTIKEYAKKGNCVFFSSHLLDFVTTICHRFAIIKEGQLLAVNDIAILEKENLSLEQYYIKTTNLEPGK